MTRRSRTSVTRRGFLRADVLAAAVGPVLAHARFASAQTPARAATKVLDFQTGADVAKAEQEGEVVYYGHDGEAGIAVLLDAFKNPPDGTEGQGRIVVMRDGVVEQVPATPSWPTSWARPTSSAAGVVRLES